MVEVAPLIFSPPGILPLWDTKVGGMRHTGILSCFEFICINIVCTLIIRYFEIQATFSYQI